MKYAKAVIPVIRKNVPDAVVLAGTPVFVSEFGLCDASGTGGNDLTQAKNWIDTMDQYGISYAVWSLCNKNETSALIASSCQKTSGFTQDDLCESGKWIYDMLHKKNGAAGISPEESAENQQKSADSRTTEQSQSRDTTGKDETQEETQTDGKRLTIHSKDYNGKLDPGESATDVGFIVSLPF